MTVGIIGTVEQLALIASSITPHVHSVTMATIIENDTPYYDLLIDFSTESNSDRIAFLHTKTKLLLINNVTTLVAHEYDNVLRFTGWHTLCNSKNLEISIPNNNNGSYMLILQKLGIPYTIVPYTIGHITPKVVSMIINEAYYTLGDGVSNAHDIDVAMQLGTGYPYGPIAWGNLIGLPLIHQLLQALSVTDARYTPAPALTAATILLSV